MNSIQWLKSTYKTIIQKTYFDCTVGAFLIIYSLYSIYEEWEEFHKGHVLFIIGFIMFLNSLKSLLLGNNWIVKTFRNTVLILKRPVMRVLFGAFMVISSLESIYQEVALIKEEHGVFVFGVMVIGKGANLLKL